MVLSFLPATALYDRLRAAHERSAVLQRLTASTLIVLFAVAASRPFAASFQPFIYFRF
jgi:hypothetical protein